MAAPILEQPTMTTSDLLPLVISMVWFLDRPQRLDPIDIDDHDGVIQRSEGP
jgi:hypothetical protein